MDSKVSNSVKTSRDNKSTKKPIKKSNSKTKKKIQKKKTKVSKNHVGEYAFNIIKDDKFRLNSQRVFFTYKHHIPFNDLYNFLNGLFPITQYIICHENGDEQHNYLHTHVSVEFEKKIDVRNCRHFDYKFNDELVHPNIGTTRNWPASCIYCLKIWKKNPVPDNKNWDSNFDVLEFLKKNKRNKCVQEINIKELCKRINSYKSAHETIENEAKELKDVIPLMAMYGNKHREIDPKLVKYYQKWEQTMRNWQKQLYNIIDSKANRRKVYWIVDVMGGQGKTDFCTYVDTIKKKDECLTIASSGSLRDISDVVRNWMDRGASPKIILIDIPRTFNDDKHNSIYTIIESIKNGRLTCTKYKGDTIQFYPPHVMVFSNWMPDVSYLSKDRWVILNLKANHANDKNAELYKINIENVKNNELDDDYEQILFDPKLIDTGTDSDESIDDDMNFAFTDADFKDDNDDPIEEPVKVTKKKVPKNHVKCYCCGKTFDKKTAKDTLKEDQLGIYGYLCSDKCIKDYDKQMW
jgi:Geminivirus Rep catalytic domain